MDITIKVNGQNLAGTLVKPLDFKKPSPTLIFVHGWKSNQTGNIKRAKEISKLGYICLTLDLRGHGESDGKLEDFSRKDHLQDIKAAYKYVSQLPEVDPGKIGVIGASYGGYLSAVATNYLKFNLLVLRVPALYFDSDSIGVDSEFDVSTDKIIRENPQAFTSSDLTVKNCLALKGVANFPGKILIIESEKDKVIPHPVIENYLKFIEPKKLSLKVMKNTPHSFETEAQEEEYLKILSNWLKKSP